MGDAGDLLRHGAPQSVLVVFGLVSGALGLWLWHGLGPHFGLGLGRGEVDRRAAAGMVGALAVLVLGKLWFSR